MNAPTRSEILYAVETEASALGEIVKLLPKLSAKSVMKLLPEIAAACELNSAIEDDDENIVAIRVDECAESLRDELGGEFLDGAQVISEHIFNDPRRA